MSEQAIIDRTTVPITVQSIVRDLRQLGIQEGDHLLVHSSLSNLGWVCGGPQAVIQALLEAVGENGTLVMPAQSGDWSDPAQWGNPPVPQEWIETIYREMPAFDPAITPTRGMGRIAELFRTYSGTVRSAHPQGSFTANGKMADHMVASHELTPQFGMASPLGKLYRLQAKVLLLGVGYISCTCMHLAETMLENMPTGPRGTAILENGNRVWKSFTDYVYDSEDFPEIGEQFEQVREVVLGKVGLAECRLFDLKEAVDYAKEWMVANRRNT